MVFDTEYDSGMFLGRLLEEWIDEDMQQDEIDLVESLGGPVISAGQ